MTNASYTDSLARSVQTREAGITSSTQSVRLLTLVLAVAANIIIYVWAIKVSQPKYLQAAMAPFTFQMIVYLLSWVVLICFMPGGYARLSEPGVLILLWLGLYFNSSTIYWLAGKYDTDLREVTWPIPEITRIIWWQALFIISIMGGYLAIRRHWDRVSGNLDIQSLPRGWLLFILPFIVLFPEIVLRLLTTGHLLPLETRADLSYKHTSELIEAMATGGIKLLILQIYYKVIIYIQLLQGVGIGLIISHTISEKRKLIKNYVVLGLGCLFLLLFGTGDRSNVIQPFIIGLIFSDMLVGPFRYRYLFALFISIFIIFQFYGAFRNIRDLPINEALNEAYKTFSEETFKEGKLGEFVGILGKEALGIRIFSKQDQEGVSHFINSAMRLFPIQIFPEKKYLQTTSEAITLAVYGTSVGRGTAGAMLVDGYRIDRIFGVPLLGALIGIIYALFHNWIIKDISEGHRGPVIYKVAIMAGVYSSMHSLIRSGIEFFITTGFYNIFLPWVFIMIFCKPNSIWRRSCKIIKK